MQTFRIVAHSANSGAESLQMPKKSAGILMYRRTRDGIEVLLVHPGGPFWSNRDLGAWSIPKGEYAESEDPEASARREFAEELGVEPQGDLLLLGELRQKSGKLVTAFALEGNFDIATLRSNTFDIEWPPRSGHIRSFPEVDRADWFALPVAREKIIASQSPFLDGIENICSGSAGPGRGSTRSAE
jgi:predicted NUDIX family NTP pyrophosphohydrolase